MKHGFQSLAQSARGGTSLDAIAAFDSEKHLHTGDNMTTRASLINTVPTHLEKLAALGDSDPCEIAEAAMPDLVIGDLAPDDESWVRKHTISCHYCSTVLETFENLCHSLDSCNEMLTLQASQPQARTTATILGVSEASYGYLETPVGDVLVASSDKGILEVSYIGHDGAYETLREIEQRGFLVYEKQASLQPVIDQLEEYFSRKRMDFSLPVDLTGVTEFTQRVLNAATSIPYGTVRTYGDIARVIGKSRASRAVGNALGRNPIPIIIPCHRVILASGAMGWYTGGPEIKRTLLEIEGVSWMDRSQQRMEI